MAKAKAPTRTRKFSSLDTAVAAAVKGYESQAEASRQMDVGKTYLCRLLSGAKDNPSDEMLARMGITRHVHYTLET